MKPPLDVRLVPAAVAGWLAAVVLVDAAPHAAWVASGAALAAALVVVLRATRAAAGGGSSGAAGAPPGGSLAGVQGARGARGAAGARAGRRSAGWLVVVSLVVVAAAGASCALTSVRTSSALMQGASGTGATVWVTGVVTSDPRPLRTRSSDPQEEAATSFRVSLDVRTVVVASPGRARESQGVAVPVSLVGAAAWEQARVGATVTAWGRLRPADGSRRERFELAGPSPPMLVDTEPAPLVVAGVVRRAFASVAEHRAPGVAGLVRGMTVGDRAGVPERVDAAMRATGLTHLTAVSGAHVAIVVGAALGVLAAARVPRLWRAGAAGVVLVGFVVLVRPDPSVLRAALMGAVALLGTALGRPSRSLSALAAVVVGLVLADPWIARSFGFVLSVVATAALVLGAAPLAAALERRRVPSWAALLVAVPVVAQLACGPVVVLLSASVPTYAVLANVLVAPVVGVATITGVVAAVLAPWWPAAAGVVVVPSCWAAAWVQGVAATLASAPGATVPWVGGALGAVLLAAATAGACVLVWSWPSVRWWWQDVRVARRHAATVRRVRRERAVVSEIRGILGPWPRRARPHAPPPRLRG